MNRNYKKPVLLLAGILLFLLGYSQPRITSFSPVSGPVGTTVTITGNNFNGSPAGNIVFFGATRAAVSSASAGSLVVTVPAGASFEPITVTTNGLTAYSAQPFRVTFPGAGPLESSSFDTSQLFETSLYPREVALADLDGDGKVDVATPGNANSPSSTINLLRNISSPGSINFADLVSLPVGDLPIGMVAADFDGDGKKDLASTYVTNSGNLAIYKNNSTIGSFSFSLAFTFATGSIPDNVVAGDVDGDGRTDLLVLNTFGGSISVYRNTSTGGVMSFAAKVDFLTGLGPNYMAMGDLDGDGKLDLATANRLSATVSYLRNTSTPGNISFTAPANIGTDPGPYGIAIGDLDSDGRPELVYTLSALNKIVLLQNLSSPGTILFAPKQELPLSVFSEGPIGVTLGDVDGDGKLDLVGAGPYVHTFKNNSTTGTLSFSYAAQLYTYSTFRVGIADLDNDGKPDYAVTNGSGGKLNVFRNKANEPFIADFSPQEGQLGDTILITGSRLSQVQTVKFGGVAASEVIVVNDGQLKAIVGPGLSGMVEAFNTFGKGYKTGFTFHRSPLIDSFSPAAAATGDTITINGSYFTGATGVFFGGVPASSFQVVSFTTIKAVVSSSGASGWLRVSSAYGSDSAANFIFYPPPSITSFTPTSGDVGTVVTITGNNFSNIVSVKIGGRAVSSYSILSTTTLQVVVGDGASGTIELVTSGGRAVSSVPFAFPPPHIATISPLKGDTNTLVTITGDHFPGNPNAVVVFFGAARATVVQAGANQLVVKVPPGATYAPISVIVNNQAVSSSQIFRMTYPDGGGLTNNAYVWNSAFPSGPDTREVVLSDLNGDGRTDILCSNYEDGSMQVLQNNTPKDGQFDFQRIEFQGPWNYNSWIYMAVGDLTGDGKPDLAYACFGGYVYVRKNTSTADQISFGPIITLPANFYKNGITIGDMDGDGKADIVASDAEVLGVNGHLMVYRNTGFDGNLSFAPGVDFTFSKYAARIRAIDMDGDGKLDITSCVYSGQSGLFVIRNTSTPGNFSFDTGTHLPSGVSPDFYTVVDLDNDGRQDLIASDYYTGILTSYRNTSQPGQIQFETGTNWPQATNIEAIAAGPLDGDDKTDFVVNLSGPSHIALFQNTTSGSTLTFEKKEETSTQLTYNYIRNLEIGDLDGDGKPEIVASSGADGKVSIFRNQLNELSQIGCEGNTTTITSELTGSTYQWQGNTGNGFFSLTNNSTYSGVTTATLSITSTQAGMNGNRYRCLVNGQWSKYVNLKVNPVVRPSGTIVVPASVCVNGSYNVAFNDVQAPNASAVELYRSIDGAAFTLVNSLSYGGGNISFPFTATAVPSSIRYYYRITPPAAIPCGVAKNSDTLTVLVEKLEIPVLTLENYKTVVVSNPVAGATYIWQQLLNGTSWVDVAPQTTGTRFVAPFLGVFRVKMIKNACSEVSLSASLDPTAIRPEPARNSGIHLYPNPVLQQLYIDSLSLSDQWESLVIYLAEGRPAAAPVSLRQKSSLSLNLSFLKPGVYEVVLVGRKKQARWRMVKL